MLQKIVHQQESMHQQKDTCQQKNIYKQKSSYVTNVPTNVENLCWNDAVWVAPVKILTGSPQTPNGNPVTMTINGIVRTIQISITPQNATSVTYEGTYGMISDGGASYVIGGISCPYAMQNYLDNACTDTTTTCCPAGDTCVYQSPNVVVPCLFTFNEVYGGVGMATTQFVVEVLFKLNAHVPPDWVASNHGPRSGVAGSVNAIVGAGATSYVQNPSAVSMPNFQWYIQNQCQTPYAYGVPG